MIQNKTTLSTVNEEVIVASIRKRQALHVEYRGNRRKVIPLVYGRLKNGKEALLCYRIMQETLKGLSVEFRLYHSEHLDVFEPEVLESPLEADIDYYLTRHFESVYCKV